MNEYVYNRFSSQSKRSKFFSRNQTYLEYFWQPAVKLSENTPTLVYFLGYNGDIPSTINQNLDWNILCIADRNGPEGLGCWYFGSHGEDYLLNSLEQFIKQLVMCGLIHEEVLFFAGKGMGGHAALYLTVRFDAPGCYVHNPTTNLLDSSYIQLKHKSLFENIFGENKEHKYRNLLSQLSAKTIVSIINISFDISTKNKYYSEQIKPISNKSVRLLETSEFNFNLIISTLKKLVPVPKEIETTTYGFDLFQSDFVHKFGVKLSSRDEIIIDEQLSFAIDPYLDRSWRFWFQNLSWLPMHLKDLSPELQKRQSEYILYRWFNHLHDSIADNEFFYHDHSLAYRGMNLLDCLPFFPEHILPEILSHIRDIGQLLLSPLEDNALSNHAYDQAISLFLISDYFKSEPYSSEWQSVALSRIKRELDYSFTPDGVHVENSPSYHHGMISNIHKSLSKVLKITEHESIKKHFEILSDSTSYLAWIIRPDGKVPPIGDSEEKQVSINLAKQITNKEFNQEVEGMRVFGDGYAIWKSTSNQYHLTLKSCHHGRFHRHDDDCSLTLWVRNQNLLMDSGLLYYLEKDPDRIHVRSAMGHSGFEIPKKKPNRNFFSKSARRANVRRIDSNTSQAVLGMYGNLYATRQVQLEGEILTINDRFSDGCISAGIRVNFVVDGTWIHEVTKNGIRFSDKAGRYWLMELIGFQEGFILEETFTSPLKNIKQKALRLSLIPKQKDVQTIIDFGGVE